MRATRTHRRRIPGVVAGLAIAGLVACGNASRPEVPVEAGSPSREPPIVEFAGCSGATRPPQPLRCTLPAAETVLHLWISATTVPVVEIDGVPARGGLRPTPGDQGWTGWVRVPADASVLSIRHADTDASDAPWRVDFDRTDRSSRVGAIDQKLPAWGSPDRTPALLRAVGELEAIAKDANESERHQALWLAMRLALDAGATERALTFGRTALREALDRNELVRVIDIAEILLHASPDESEKDWLVRLLEISIGLAGDGRHLARLAYFRGYRASLRGDIGTALDDAELSERTARRLGLVTDELIAAGFRTAQLALIGDTSASDAARDRVLTLVAGRPRAAACNDAHVLNTAARSLLSRRLLGDVTADPGPLLSRVGAYFEKGGGCDVGDNPTLKSVLAGHHVDIANDALSHDDVATAEKHVARVSPESLTPAYTRWLTFVRADLAYRKGDFAEALVLTHDFDVTKSEQPLVAWKTMLLRASAHAALGDSSEALRDALAAETVLDRAAGMLAPDQGRESMAALFHASAARAVEIQLKSGDVRAAVATARRARARRLRPVGLEEAVTRLDAEGRSRYQAARGRYRELSTRLASEMTELWRLPAVERARASHRHREIEEGMRSAAKEADAILRAAPPGTTPSTSNAPDVLSLLYHPTPQGWVAFAIHGDQAEVARFQSSSFASPDAAADALLRPFETAIDEATSIRVLAVGEVMAVDVHALPWHGAPLVLAKPVAYGIDLGTPPGNRTSTHAALVVADPATRIPGLGRLPNAAAEGAEVDARLRASGWQVQQLVGEDAAHNEVIAALERVEWLHYAGHGVAAGPTGWDSGLPLAGEAILDVPAILGAARIPSAVVLSACETAGTSNPRGASMQIATAFLLAGADFVVAAQGGVDDETAPRFSRALYDAAGGDLRGPELGRAAVSKLVEAGEPMSTWVGFRVWVR